MHFKKDSLIPKAISIIRDKQTESPFSGTYNDFTKPGTYLCRQCGLALFRSYNKFSSHCGWPSFDEEINNHVNKLIDADGIREEIICSRCNAHLGHIFIGENFTEKNKRYCVNSLSLDFVNNLEILDTEEAIFAAGCFWGVEHLFKQLPGVLKTEVGYCGGSKVNPTYEEICQHQTGHYEAVRILFDPQKINYEKLVHYFFEIHNFSQDDGQGPDKGSQYLSRIFYFNKAQKETAEIVIKQLKEKSLVVHTQVLPMSTFWRAEDYHQSYYEKNDKEPYCHFYTKIF